MSWRRWRGGGLGGRRQGAGVGQRSKPEPWEERSQSAVELPSALK